MRIKLIVWDWNGTLLNDVDYCVGVMNKILKKYHLESINADFYRRIFTFPVKKYYQKLGFDFSVNSFEKVGLEFIEDYNKNIDLCSLNSNATEILSIIREYGIKQVIISAREHNSLIEDIKSRSIDSYFDSVVGILDNYASSKLHLFNKIISDYAFSNDEIMLIGDTIHDCEIAKELNINFIHFLQGHQDLSHFNSCKNMQSIEDLSELKKIISF